MTDISVILGHPDVNSFNYAIARTAVEFLQRNNHAVRFHDLYRENFPGYLPVEEIPSQADMPDAIRDYCKEISLCDGIIIVHPNWWGQPPAILKGWVDRIIRPGVAYKFLEGDKGEGVPQGLLRAKAALVFNTTNTPEAREKEAFGDPLDAIWKNCIFGLCGVKNVYRRSFGVIVTSTPEQRKEWLGEVEETVGRYFPRI
jgi:NAD(P)H dehydrogenase (quinone)